MKASNVYISTRTRYALRVLFDLAFHRGEMRSVAQIAETRSLPPKYIAQLMTPLRRAGYITSKSGPGGGFRILRPDAKITVLNVMETMDGPFHIMRCLANPSLCSVLHRCGTYRMWRRLNKSMRDLMNSINMAQMLKEYNHIERVGGKSLCLSYLADAPSAVQPLEVASAVAPLPVCRGTKPIPPKRRRSPGKKKTP